MRWVLVLLCLAGCKSNEVELRVDLRSDLLPRQEVSSSRTVVALDGIELDFEETDLRSEDSLVDAVRIANLSVPKGLIRMSVVLSDPAGGVVLQRDVVIDIRESSGVTVLMTRSCRGVSCPDASDASATACLGGRCARPECTPENPELCPDDGCSADSDCDDAAVECVRAVCLDGACGSFPDRALCGERDLCDPTRGCVAEGADAGMFDGGTDAETDAGTDASSDAGTDAGTDAGADAGTDAGPTDCDGVCPGTCESGTCVIRDVDSPVCPDGVPCRVDCFAGGSCAGTVTCGNDECEVDCSGPDSCATVDCSRASSCAVQCDGTTACGHISCAAGANTVNCIGPDSCTTIDCSRADSSSIDCTAPGSCGAIVCGGATCVVDCVFSDCNAIDCTTACQCQVNCPGAGCTMPALCPPMCQSGSGCMFGSADSCDC